MSVGLPLAGPGSTVEPLRLFDPGVDAQPKTLVQRACDTIGMSATGDPYFSDAAHDCLMAVLDAPLRSHGESVSRNADMFFSRVCDLIGLLERMSPDANVLQELKDIRRRCIRTFPEAFAEPMHL